MGDAQHREEVVGRLTIPALRALLENELKTFIDWKEPESSAQLAALIDQWKTTQGGNKSIYKSVAPSQQSKKTLACFHCGKMGHLARECRSKTSEPLKTEPLSRTNREDKIIRCFACG